MRSRWWRILSIFGNDEPTKLDSFIYSNFEFCILVMLKCAPVVVMAVPLVCLEYSMVIFLFSDFFLSFFENPIGNDDDV